MEEKSDYSYAIVGVSRTISPSGIDVPAGSGKFRLNRKVCFRSPVGSKHGRQQSSGIRGTISVSVRLNGGVMNSLPSLDSSGSSAQASEYPTWDKKRGHDRYQDLIDSNSSAVYSCDATGAITYFNNRAAVLWGREPGLGDTEDRFCSSRMLYRVDGKCLPHDQSPMADVLAGRVEGIFDAEAHIQRPDGKRIVVIVNIAPLIDDNGHIVGAVNSFRENPLRKHPK